VTTHPEQPLAFLFPGLIMLDLQPHADTISITARAARPTAPCPVCAIDSDRVHSYYTRRPRDLPICGYTVQLVLHVRRWRCLNTSCARQTFSDPLPDLLAPAAQRTSRLRTALQHLALALGGEAGARQSQRQARPASPATLLRLTRQIALPQRATPRVLAVDDFAFRKRRSYGTLLVNGDDHHPVDLLPERSAAALATWLRHRPGVEIITRDRATEYARGASDGAPQALQVLDRWHLIGNAQEALSRLLDRLRPRLQCLLTAAADTPACLAAPEMLSIYDRDQRRGTKDQVRQQQSRARRYAVYAEVQALHRDGKKILQIARTLQISRQTVRRYIASESFPEISRQRRQASILDPYVAYLQERWDAGCRANKQLYAELQARGYSGSLRPLVQWTMLRRDHEAGYRRPYGRKPQRQVEVFAAHATVPAVAQERAKVPGATSLAWLLLKDPATRSQEEQILVQQLTRDLELTTAVQFVQQFVAMVRERRPERLDAWLQACCASGLGEVVTFADVMADCQAGQKPG
jgi:transposase